MMSPMSPSLPPPPPSVPVTEQLSRFIVFLESKEKPDNTLAFVSAACEASLQRSRELEELLTQLRRQPELDLQSCSFSPAVVCAALFVKLAEAAPLVSTVAYDLFVLLHTLPDAQQRHAALRAQIETQELVVGDFLELLGRWCSGYQLDEVCAFFATLVLRPRDPTSPYVSRDAMALPGVLREMVLAWGADPKLRAPLQSTVTQYGKKSP